MSADKTMKTWNIEESLEPIQSKTVHTDEILTVNLNEKSERIFSGCKDGTINVYDRKTLDLLTTLSEHKDSITKVTSSLESACIASCSKDGTIIIWSVDLGHYSKMHTITHTRKEHIKNATDIDFSPCGKYLVASYEIKKTAVIIWEVKTGKKSQELIGHHNYALCVAYSRSGKYIASGGKDKSVIIWYAATGQLFNTIYGFLDDVISISYSVDNDFIFTGDQKGRVQKWKAVDYILRNPFKGHNGFVQCVDFSPLEGRIVSAGSDKIVCMWDAYNGDLLDVFEHKSTVYSVSFCPDSIHFASGSRDGLVRIWDSVNKKLVCALKGHTSIVYTVKYSPDGKNIISSGRDNDIFVWDAIAHK